MMNDDRTRSDDIVTLSPHAFDLFTGDEQDAEEILRLHRAYLDANSHGLKINELREVWSDHPSCVWFNGTGYNYYGIEDWVKLWQYFGPRVEVLEPWRSFDVRLIGDGSMAVVTCERTAAGKWLSEGDKPGWTEGVWPSRSTEGFRKENGRWRCVHVHISTQAQGERYDRRG